MSSSVIESNSALSSDNPVEAANRKLSFYTMSNAAMQKKYDGMKDALMNAFNAPLNAPANNYLMDPEPA